VTSKQGSSLQKQQTKTNAKCKNAAHHSEENSANIIRSTTYLNYIQSSQNLRGCWRKHISVLLTCSGRSVHSVRQFS